MQLLITKLEYFDPQNLSETQPETSQEFLKYEYQA
jgi:hypothetical protein